MQGYWTCRFRGKSSHFTWSLWTPLSGDPHLPSYPTLLAYAGRDGGGSTLDAGAGEVVVAGAAALVVAVAAAAAVVALAASVSRTVVVSDVPVLPARGAPVRLSL